MTDFFAKLNNLEPARVRAAWAAVVALLVALGIANAAHIDGIGTAAITAFFALLPLVQGELTRAKVTPQFKVDEAAKEADMIAEMDALAGDE